MKEEDIPPISPLIQKWHPLATPEKQRQYTAELRAYLACLYRIYLRIEAERECSDSRESNKDAMVESDNHHHP